MPPKRSNKKKGKKGGGARKPRVTPRQRDNAWVCAYNKLLQPADPLQAVRAALPIIGDNVDYMPRGFCPLGTLCIVAAGSGHVVVVELLLARGADPNKATTDSGAQSRSAA